MINKVLTSLLVPTLRLLLGVATTKQKKVTSLRASKSKLADVSVEGVVSGTL